MKKIISIVLVVLSLTMLLSVFTVGASASSAYQTYTYAIDGTPRYSPDAYSATYSIDSTKMKLDIALNSPSDLITDKNEKVYIADTGNNRIVVLSRYYEFEFAISTFTNSQGNNDELSGPEGVFVTDDSIWVCDTKKSRIVRFDLEGNFMAIIDEPESQLFAKNHVYTPVAMAIDQYGRMYIVSSSTYQGIIVMDPEGNFVGFVGSQASSISAWELIMRRFRTEEQQDAMESTLTTEFNNVAITPDGFIYATTSSIDEGSVSSAITGKSKEGKFMPVKLLNPAGDEIMRRNGFWPPAGEVAFSGSITSTVQGPSTVIDVAVGPEKTWSIIDSKRNKIYTYDFNGNLLFAFGDKGSLLGSIGNIKAICYQNDTMLILDKSSPTATVIVYERTGYGDLLLQAIAAENSLDYNYAIECWESVLQRNSNFDAAYVGIGNALYRSGEYAESLEYYEKAYDTENWSNSYKEVRKEWMSSYFILLMVILVLIIVALVKFFGFAAKYNKKVAVNGLARKTFVQELMYGFYVIFHPFDGFYDLKHEHRGSVRASIVFLALTIIAFFYQGIGQGYVMNPTHAYSTIFEQLIAVLVPFFLFTIANWCLTTLFEGEGSFKDIFIATSYSLLPLPLLVIPATLCSNWVTNTEASIVEMVVTLAFIWAFLLIFFGTMVTHDYSMGKNVITTLGTILAMACIVFIVLLFSLLLSKLVGLVTNIVTEIQFRL
ncbi:MAG: YIP1 family protein [Clostridia bacterium]|nr:YIP1 family protein [Clostridia bacterium]